MYNLDYNIVAEDDLFFLFSVPATSSNQSVSVHEGCSLYKKEISMQLQKCACVCARARARAYTLAHMHLLLLQLLSLYCETYTTTAHHGKTKHVLKQK